MDFLFAVCREVCLMVYLPSTHFQRISRSFTINLDCVTRFLGNMVYIGERDFLISPAYRETLWSCFTFLKRMRALRK